MKNDYYKIDDHCETPFFVEGLKGAMEALESIMDGIDVGYPVEIVRVKMTKKQYEALPEL